MSATATRRKSRDGASPAAPAKAQPAMMLQSAAAPSPFTPIANYGLLSDLVTSWRTPTGWVIVRDALAMGARRGEEGTFVICSFWLVSALVVIGEMQRARDLMERLTKVASPLGLYAEEFDVDTGRHLGNFPQAFSYLALVEAAARIVLAERLGEIGA